MIAWVIIRSPDAVVTRLTLDDSVAKAEILAGSLVWQPSNSEMPFIEEGFMPRITRRVWRHARRCSRQLRCPVLASPMLEAAYA